MLFFISFVLADVELQPTATITAAQISPPADLKAEHLGSSAVLSWTPRPQTNSPEELGYVVFKSNSALGPWNVESSLIPFEENSFKDTNIDSKTTYCYRVATIPQNTPTEDFSILWDTLLNYGSISSTICAPPKPASKLPLFAGLFVLCGAMMLYVYRRTQNNSTDP